MAPFLPFSYLKDTCMGFPLSFPLICFLSTSSFLLDSCHVLRTHLHSHTSPFFLRSILSHLVRFCSSFLPSSLRVGVSIARCLAGISIHLSWVFTSFLHFNLDFLLFFLVRAPSFFFFFVSRPAARRQGNVDMLLPAGHRAELPQVLGRGRGAGPRPAAPDERERHPRVRFRAHDRHAGTYLFKMMVFVVCVLLSYFWHLFCCSVVCLLGVAFCCPPGGQVTRVVSRTE